MKSRKRLLLLLLLPLLLACDSDLILSEEQLSDDIFYGMNSTVPFTGKCTFYYKNSKTVHYIFNYKDGITDGDFSCYYRNGNLNYRGKYSDGKLCGELIRYAENGSVNFRINTTH